MKFSPFSSVVFSCACLLFFRGPWTSWSYDWIISSMLHLLLAIGRSGSLKGSKLLNFKWVFTMGHGCS